MNYWIFQSVPERNDLRETLEEGKEETWLISRFWQQMSSGDLVFLGLAGPPTIRGIYGWGKRSHFPLAATSRRAYNPGEESQESPMLLTPYDVDLDRDFEFVFAKRGMSCTIVGKTERAEATIRICTLDRGELSISRGEQWLRAQQDFIALALVYKNGEKARKEFEATAQRREFSAACRAAVNRLSA